MRKDPFEKEYKFRRIISLIPKLAIAAAVLFAVLVVFLFAKNFALLAVAVAAIVGAGAIFYNFLKVYFPWLPSFLKINDRRLWQLQWFQWRKRH